MNAARMTIRRSESLGTAHSGDVTLRCHFAFADWQDPRHVHEGSLRAVNLLSLPAGERYRIGPESNVEILTWVERGSLTAEIDDFSKENLKSGDLHLVSAGQGCTSLNWSAEQGATDCLQFWLLPDQNNSEPTQEVRQGFPDTQNGAFRILASGFPEDDPEEGETVADGSPIALQTRARLLRATLPANEGAVYQTTPGRDLYLIVILGHVTIKDAVLFQGDAAAFENCETFTVIAQEKSVLLLTDVPAI
ncbi:pirin family protein [Acetobacter aceti]|uniref:Putative quercetin 2,3-dioxygenase n=1 Tax=Acetobacter aceti TaxID=435 RepID=A0A6S6PPA4_ACEAC|nr:pirin family protein [Acetobacter aceti]BCI66502.1 putative quercetin 2,3-dioxygenase [Acetobacter aceti]